MLQGNTLLEFTQNHATLQQSNLVVNLSILLHFAIVTFHANAAGLLILRDIISPI